jgi:OCT family organic cation transporter-like MFS transporter 4/5
LRAQGSELLVLPLMIMGVLLVLGGVGGLALPETLNQHLPQTLEDGEAFGEDWRMRDILKCCPATSP